MSDKNLQDFFIAGMKYGARLCREGKWHHGFEEIPAGLSIDVDDFSEEFTNAKEAHLQCGKETPGQVHFPKTIEEMVPTGSLSRYTHVFDGQSGLRMQFTPVHKGTWKWWWMKIKKWFFKIK